jgi:quinoprotein glucose dehydrogenase
MNRHGTQQFVVCIFAFVHLTIASAQDWPYYGATKGGTKYSTAAIINRSNVDSLEQVWVYRTGEEERLGKRFSKTAFQVTPILVEGSLVLCTPSQRIIALDPASGEERWVFDPEIDLDINVLDIKCRGVEAWVDETAAEESVCRTRILVSTIDFRLIAVDARDGRLCPGFGNNGVVTIPYDKDLAFSGEVVLNNPPVVVNGVVILGSAVYDGVRADGPSGMVRAFDARTGTQLWTFDPVPRDPEDPMYATWSAAAANIGATNVWTIMSVDEERDLVFLPTSSPSSDYYGGHRPGENRYSNSVVALRGATGEVVWHFQTSHHDVWDFDLPAQPILIDLDRDGKKLPALLQITKQAFVFVVNRATGEPLFPVEERPVLQNGVPGEQLSPTQPYPLSPPPFMQQGISADDAWGFTYFDRMSCKRKLEAHRLGGLYTPPSLEGTVMLPGLTGGGNWGGGAYDPDTGLLIVNSTRIPAMIRLIPASTTENRASAPTPALTSIVFPQSGTAYKAETSFIFSPLGAPCTKPPWGGLTAIDLASGAIKWDVALGSMHRMTLLPLPFTWNLGTPVAGGPIVTAGGLVFVASTMDRMFRAFDIETGVELWHVDLPVNGNATPMTYVSGGRQFVVLAAGGHFLYGPELGDYLIAYALPR